MSRILGILLASMISLSAIEIPLDLHLKAFSLENGIEIWVREYVSSQVACRFIGQDPRQAKPQIFDLDCPAEIFEEELSSFLDYCEEEIQKKGGESLGIVAVGSMNFEGLQSYLANRYETRPIKNSGMQEAVQLIPTSLPSELQVLLRYQGCLYYDSTDEDLKELWVFYLIQSMAEKRFKKAALEANCKWMPPEESRYLLPSCTTLAEGIQKISTSAENKEQLLRSFLEEIKILKEKGFTQSELADSKSQLIKHLKRFYEVNPDEKKLADYYASHMGASIPCSEYTSFMTLSLHLIPEISMANIAEGLKKSFKDDSRQVVINHPINMSIAKAEVENTLTQFVSDSIEFKYEETVNDGKDPFSQLLITEEEQNMMRGVIQTVAEKAAPSLFFIQGDLKKKRAQLLHIHPLRSLATIFTDSYTRKCVAEIMNSSLKRPKFIEDYAERLSQESGRNNLLCYVHGFSLAVKANPDQIRLYIKNRKWTELIYYLLKVNS